MLWHHSLHKQIVHRQLYLRNRRIRIRAKPERGDKRSENAMANLRFTNEVGNTSTNTHINMKHAYTLESQSIPRVLTRLSHLMRPEGSISRGWMTKLHVK